MESKVAELVRVARDGSAIIVRNEDSSYVRVGTTENAERTSAASLSDLTEGTAWRRVTGLDRDRFAEQVIVASGKVFTESEEKSGPRLYRVPPTVKKSISSALEAYSSLLSDGDREIATRLATRTQVDADDVAWMHRFFENIEKAQSLHGGKRGQSWARKVLNAADDALTAAAATDETVFDLEADNPNVTFFAGGNDPEGEVYDTLYMLEVTGDEEFELDDDEAFYVWRNGEFVPSEVGPNELDREFVIEVDPETAKKLAELLDNTELPEDEEFEGYSLVDFYPEERNIFELAQGELDYEELDRFTAVLADATGYSAPERSQNAQRQPRAPGGQFGGGSPEPVGQETNAFAKAKLTAELPLVADLNALLDEYLADVAGQAPTDDAAPEEDSPVVAAGMDSGVAPLYLAIVDDVDKTAVMDVVAIIPGEDGSATGWRREAGEWRPDDEIVADLRGDTPPPTVQLEDADTVKNVLSQVDQYDGQEVPEEEPDTEVDGAIAASAWELSGPSAAARDKAAKKGQALPDGSFPIRNESDLKKAIQAFGRAKNKAAAKRHIKKRARALNRTDLIPEDWKNASLFDDEHLVDVMGPYGELMAVTAAGIPGISDTPSDAAAVERLREYWSTGAGAAKIGWGTPGDLTRCHQHLTKYLKNSDHAWGYCNNLHKRIFGRPNPESGR